MQIGPIKLENDTIIVLAITAIATGLIVALSGLAMLATYWNQDAESPLPERPAIEVVVNDAPESEAAPEAE